MNTKTRNLIIAPIIGVAAYLIIGLVQHQSFHIPGSVADVAELAIIIAAVMIGSFLASAESPGIVVSTAEETGTVKWFNVKKRYGFITRDQGDDVFVHYRNIIGEGRRAIADGQRVKFIVVSGDKGLQADEVEAL